MQERRVEFNSCGDKIVGVLQLPDGAKGPMPLLIMAGGWCYTKEIVMPYYAQYFHEIGVGTLLFDYRCFGESEGKPRQHINPWDQIEDYKNAITWAGLQPMVDADDSRGQRLPDHASLPRRASLRRTAHADPG